MLNLILTIIVPVMILTRFSGEDSLGPDKALLLALALADRLRHLRVDSVSPDQRLARSSASSACC